MMFEDLPTSRSEAKNKCSKYYFTSRSCINGHLDKRKTTNGRCMECDRMRQRDRMKNDPEYRNLHRKSCLKRITRILSDPEKRKQIREREKELHHSSPNRKLAKKCADKIRHERLYKCETHRLIITEKSKRYYAIKKDDPQYKEQMKIRTKLWAIDNPVKVRARCARRRAFKKLATPQWLTEKMMSDIDQFYWMANELSKVTGVKYEVDHIVPLVSNKVCGLHVPWNLQLLSDSENRSKSNRLDQRLATR
jgi:hypothetical protein